ncbi:MAG: hypothetical protein J6J97_10320 [Akkermansia sp.]|nr:hypothetical protein [Akkermansia sp.]
METKKIKVAFADFTTTRNEMSFFIEALKNVCDVVECEDSPDILFYSCFGLKHLRVRGCTKVYVCQENVAPDFNECDYAISCMPISFGERHLFMPPCYATYMNRQCCVLPQINQDMARRKFCSFLYSQENRGNGSILRKKFCQMLMQYQHVDSPGAVLHNVDIPELKERNADDWNVSKIQWLSGYKFNIAFENSYSEGYVTEKLMDCFYANTVPIYWGGIRSLPFPKEAMICVNDFESFDDAIERIREVDQNDEMYLSMLAANPLRAGLRIEEAQEKLIAFLRNIVDKEFPVFEKDGLSFSDASRLRLLALSGALIPGGIAFGIRHALHRYMGSWLRPNQHRKGSVADRQERMFLSEMLNFSRGR